MRIPVISSALSWIRKHSAVGGMIALYNAGRAVWTPRRYDQFAKEGYQKNVIAFAAVRMVARSAASVPWLLYKKRRSRMSRREELTDHPLLTLLNRPNPMQGGSAFFEALYGFFLIAGNSYVEGVGAERRPPSELYVHRPDRVKVVPGRFGLPSAYEYNVSGTKKTWEVDAINGRSPVLHLKTFNPLDDWYGMSPIEAAAYAIDTHNQAGEWNKALLDNGGRPAGSFIYEGSGGLNDPDLKRLKAELQEHYVGSKNAGKPFITGGGLRWEEQGFSPKDMDFINSKHTSARDIALAFGPPPMLLGIPGDNTYSNYKEARLALWEDTVLPLVGGQRDEFNNWLVPPFGDDIELDYDEDQISALTDRREKTWKKVNESNFLTTNEKREAVGYDTIPGGDKVLVPATMLPLGFGEGGDDSGSDAGDDAKDLELKLLGDDTPEKRAREWVVQNRLMASLERGFVSKGARLLKEQAERAARAFADDGTQGVAVSMNEHTRELGMFLPAHYSSVMEVFGKRVKDGLKSLDRDNELEVKFEEDFYEKFIKEWIARHTAKRVEDIAKTTRDLILKAIEEGETAGESVAKIADRIIERAGGEFALSRARTIARTETHASAMAANDGAARATGLAVVRQWVSARDANTRDSHLLTDGQTRGMDEPFDVNGKSLMRPGDPDGPPEEIINCRCVTTYITRR